jgi:polyisoprenoid-binding protein YceI
MNRNAKLALGIGAAVVALAAVAFVLINVVGGGDGPAELTFDDAPSTTSTTATTGGATDTPAPGAELDGSWVITGGSQAGYRVLEDRIGGIQNIEAVGRTSQVSGGFTVSGTTVQNIRADVDVASITSDSSFRDGRFAGSIMDSATFPTATFTAASATLPAVPADGETITVPVSGELTLKGTTRPAQVDLQIKRTGEQVQILGSVPVTFADFGIETPQPPGLSVRDQGTVEFLLVAQPG